MRSAWAPLIAATTDALAQPLAWLPELERCYAEPHRRYHGLAHIDALAGLFEQIAAGPGWRQPAEVALAVLFHDAIYDPSRTDNEQRSAELALAWLADTPVELERIAALIAATAAHGQSAPGTDTDLALFLDADTAILGVSADRYDRYAREVFDEFAHVVGERAYRAGRQAFLAAQLGRPQLFHSAWFRDRFEAQARINLARELGELRSPTIVG